MTVGEFYVGEKPETRPRPGDTGTPNYGPATGLDTHEEQHEPWGVDASAAVRRHDCYVKEQSESWERVDQDARSNAESK